MKDISVLIVEDQTGVALDIKKKVRQAGFNVVGICQNETELLVFLKENKPNIILLDIDLGTLRSGIDIAEDVFRDYRIPAIFVSGIDSEIVEQQAINRNPMGYLHKPVQLNQLRTEIKRVLRKQETESTGRYYSEKIWMKDGHDYLALNKANILYLEAEKGYCEIYLSDNKKPILRSDTMAMVLKELNDIRFLQIHKKYSVNWDHVIAIRGGEIQLRNVSALIPIGRSYKDLVDQRKK